MRKESARQLFPWRLSQGPRMSLSSVLLLLGFLLIFGNIVYSNKASLEKSKPFLEMLMIALAQDMTINIKSAKKRSQV